MTTTIITGMIAAALFVVTLCVLLSRERGHKSSAAVKRLEEAAPRKPATSAAFADFSDFDQDRLLRNRSERWD